MSGDQVDIDVDGHAAMETIRAIETQRRQFEAEAAARWRRVELALAVAFEDPDLGREY